MFEAFSLLMSFPSVVWLLPGLALVAYWLMVIAGAVDLNLGAHLFETADGVLDSAQGALQGVEGAEAALHGADSALEGAEGALHGGHAAEGVADGVDHAVGAEAHVGPGVLLTALGMVLGLFKVGRVPITIPLSLFTFSGWMSCLLAAWGLARSPVPLPWGDLVVLAGSGAVGLVAAQLGARPLVPVFQQASGRERSSLIGEVARVRTGRVDERFGQAEVQIGGDHLVVEVRDDVAERGVGRGAEVLLVSFDAQRDAFVVEPLEPAADRAALSAAAARGRERESES